MYYELFVNDASSNISGPCKSHNVLPPYIVNVTVQKVCDDDSCCSLNIFLLYDITFNVCAQIFIIPLL